ncbi:MAG: hypothetical protein H0W99_08525 [Acidobacteria bacterium]|nr:hypothetical protein [Acidobacteriota bacterium]
MSEYIAIVFTGMAAVATIVYTFYSIQLWRASRASVEVARLSAFVNLLTQVNNSCYADKIEGFNLTHELPEQKRRFLRSVAANCPVKPLFSKNCVTRKSASEPNVFRVKRKLPFLFA